MAPPTSSLPPTFHPAADTIFITWKPHPRLSCPKPCGGSCHRQNQFRTLSTVPVAGSASGPRCPRTPSVASPSSHTPGLHLSWSLGFALHSAWQTPPGPDFQTMVRLHLSSVCVPRPLLQHAPSLAFFTALHVVWVVLYVRVHCLPSRMSAQENGPGLPRSRPRPQLLQQAQHTAAPSTCLLNAIASRTTKRRNTGSPCHKANAASS